MTIGGIFIVSILIGTITSGLEARLRRAAQGPLARASKTNLTLILGWSQQGLSRSSASCCIANANQKDPRIVILAERDKVEMEDDIRAKFPSTEEHARDLPQRRSARSRRPRRGATRTRRARSSCWRPRPKTPTSTLSSRCWPSPTTRRASRAVSHRRRDPRAAEPRSRRAGGRQRSHVTCRATT